MAKGFFDMKEKRSKNKEGKNSKTTVSLRRFGLIYISLMGAFLLLIGLKPIQDFVDLNGSYTEGVIFITSKVLNLTGIPCAYEGSIIRLPSISLDVKFGCNGLEAVMIYAIAVIAFPAGWKIRLAGIAAGLVIIQVINILRITLLAYSAIHFKSLFEYIHIYVAQGLMIAAALGIFFIYLTYAQEPRDVS